MARTLNNEVDVLNIASLDNDIKDSFTRAMITEDVNTTSAAARKYLKGEYFIHTDRYLYKALDDIEAGTTITPDVNAEVVTVSEELVRLFAQSPEGIFEILSNVENTSVASKNYAKGSQFIWTDKKLYEATADIASGSTFVVGTNIKLADNLTSQIQTLTNHLTTENLGSIASLSALETALTNLIPNIGLGAVKPFIFSNTANLGSPFPSVTGGWSGTIQPRSTASANVNSALIHIWNQLGHDYTIIGFDNNGTFTWYEDGFDGATVKSTVSKVISGDAITQIIPANTSMDNVIEYLQHNDRGVSYGMSSWSWWNGNNINKVGAVIPARKWFWFNGKLCRALADIAKDAAMTLNTNYQQSALLDTLGTAESIYVGDTNDGTTKKLAYNVQRYRYVVVIFKTNYEYDFMLIPISQLTINALYIKSMMSTSSASSGLISDFDLKSTAIVTFLSYSSFKCTAAYTNVNWSLKVHRIIGIY